MSKWQNARYSEPWGRCGTCSRSRPAEDLWLNPTYGWQCHDCWGGLLYPGAIPVPIFPGEGTRRTLAPLTQTLTEGVDPTDYSIWLYDLDSPSSIYRATFGDFFSFAPDTSSFSYSGFPLAGAYVGYIRSGSFFFDNSTVLNNPWFLPLPSGATFTVTDDGSLIYVPFSP